MYPCNSARCACRSRTVLILAKILFKSTQADFLSHFVKVFRSFGLVISSLVPKFTLLHLIANPCLANEQTNSNFAQSELNLSKSHSQIPFPLLCHLTTNFLSWYVAAFYPTCWLDISSTKSSYTDNFPDRIHYNLHANYIFVA